MAEYPYELPKPNKKECYSYSGQWAKPEYSGYDGWKYKIWERYYDNLIFLNLVVEDDQMWVAMDTFAGMIQSKIDYGYKIVTITEKSAIFKINC